MRIDPTAPVTPSVGRRSVATSCLLSESNSSASYDPVCLSKRATGSTIVRMIGPCDDHFCQELLVI
jgi:hypothetical protein